MVEVVVDGPAAVPGADEEPATGVTGGGTRGKRAGLIDVGRLVGDEEGCVDRCWDCRWRRKSPGWVKAEGNGMASGSWALAGSSCDPLATDERTLAVTVAPIGESVGVPLTPGCEGRFFGGLIRLPFSSSFGGRP